MGNFEYTSKTKDLKQVLDRHLDQLNYFFRKKSLCDLHWLLSMTFQKKED